MSQIKGLFIDIDGVLIEDGEAISGAVERLNELRQQYRIRLLTNTTTKTAADIHQLLTQLGFVIKKEEIITAPVAAKIVLEKKGFTCVYPVVNDRILTEFEAFTIDKDRPEAIIIGDIGERWNYDMLNGLFKILTNGAELIALHKGKFWKNKGALQLDIGAFVAALEYATAKTSTVIGKPNVSFFGAALQSIALLKEEVLMIGDDIDGDVGGAQQAGLSACLVKTGKYNAEFVSASAIRPDQVVSSFAEIFD